LIKNVFEKYEIYGCRDREVGEGEGVEEEENEKYINNQAKRRK